MVRRSKRPRADCRHVTRQKSGDRVNRNHLERLELARLGKYAGEAPREHRLPRPGGAGHAKVVSACRCNLESTLGCLLPNDVSKVEKRFLTQMRCFPVFRAGE